MSGPRGRAGWRRFCRYALISLSGDYGALYLGWLGAIESGEIDDDELEPPVPEGIGTLNASLDRLADFLRLSRDLIAVAAEASPSPGEQASSLSQEEFGKWLLRLPSQEKDRLLLGMVEGDNPHRLAELRQQAMTGAARGDKAGQRTPKDCRPDQGAGRNSNRRAA